MQETKIEPEFVQFDSEIGKKVLYTPTKKVENIDSQQVQTMLLEMKEKMQGLGVGIAANQTGYSLQAFMIQYTSNPNEKAHTSRYKVVMPNVPFQIFINPKITAVSEENMSFWHGCLSAMGHKRGKLATYKWIEYEAYDENGVLKKGRLDDLGAIIFQHEFRHLLGSIYVDHAQEFKSLDELTALYQTGQARPYEKVDAKTPHLLADYVVGESIEQYATRNGF